MNVDESPTPSEEVARNRRSNRRTIIAIGVIVAVFAAPALFRIVGYLIDLL